MIGYGWYGYETGWSWVMMLGMGLFWLLVLVALVLFIVWLYRGLSGAGQPPTALEILRQRYAKGDISKKEFEEMRKALER